MCVVSRLGSRNRFVGRVAERVALRSQLEAHPLVTLVGTAGVGKTRLAIEVADELESATGRHVLFCDLANAVTADDLCRVVARALELATVGPDAVTRIRAALAGRPKYLLVLDNLEHLTAHAPTTLATWIGAGGAGRILATSRDRLGLANETVFALEPLSVPPEGNDAVELLVERAFSAGATGLGSTEKEAISAIVRDLDGLPLAIELAAARLGVLSAGELLRLLPRKLDLLTRAPRGTVSRHQTLRASIEWSWGLLDPKQRDCLARCSVFRGRFGLEAAAAVLGEDPVPTLDVLQSLHDHSLLRAESSDLGARFSLLTSIRAFADEMLRDEARTSAHSAFVTHTLTIARDALAATELRGTAGLSEPLRAALLPEVDNFAEALRLQREAGRDGGDAIALELTIALGLVISIRGPFARYLELLDDVLRQRPPREDTERSRLFVDGLVMRARVRRLQGDLAGADVDAEQAVALAPDIPTLAGKAWAMRGLVHTDRGRFEEARAAYAKAEKLLISPKTASRAGNACAAAALYVELGDVERLSGNMARAGEIAERALRIFRAEGEPRGTGRALNLLAIARTNEARHDEAATAYAEAVALFEQVGDRRLEAMARGNLAMLLQDRRQFAEALGHYERATTMLGELGDVTTRASYLALTGTLLHETDRVADACLLYESALDEFRRAGQPRSVALGLAHHGAALAGIGGLSEAEAAFDEAETILSKIDDRLSKTAVAVHRAHLDAARGLRAEVERRRSAGLASEGDSQQIRRALRLLERVAPTAHDPQSLVIGAGGAWFRVPLGRTVDLARRQNLRQLVAGLAHERIAEPGAAVSASKLVAFGWPGEQIRPDAARLRLRVALTTLRKLGLQDLLRSSRQGWWIDDSVPIVSSQSGEPPLE